jgi:GTP-binding protein
MYFVDLPGYGYAPGAGAARDFDEITRGVFGSVGLVSHARPTLRGALLLVDARHPGLDKDRQAWAWLHDATPNGAVVATKIDKLARGERIRALRELESVFEDSVLPVSAVTGEGLDELWKLIDRLASNRNINPRSRKPSIPLKETALRPPKK